MMTEERMVSIRFEDAQRIFDLAVGADQMCSGYMETDDVHAMRRLAVIISVDPSVCTSSEFVTYFPHKFKPYTRDAILDQNRERVLKRIPDTGAAWNIEALIPETDDEVIARLGILPTSACGLSGRWGVCNKSADDPIHEVQ